MPASGAHVTVDAEPFLGTGTATEVPVTISVPKDAPTARNVELALKVPDGWTATTDDTTRIRSGTARRDGDRDLHRHPAPRPGSLRRPVRDREADADRPSSHRHR